MEKLLEGLRAKLVGTDTRSRLINVNLDNKYGNVLVIVNERSEDVFKILRSDKRKMQFKATGMDDVGDDDLLLIGDDSGDQLDESRYTDSFLETNLGPEGLQRRLIRLSSDARILEEEQGISSLYLAMGFLNWRENKTSSFTRKAPLILLPVELKRNERGQKFSISCREDDIETNLSLSERLKKDFGINLPEIDDSIDWKPSEYFAEIRSIISEYKDWKIDEDAICIGFFSFAKLLMYRDLDARNWRDLVDNALIRRLLKDCFEEERPGLLSGEDLDKQLNTVDLVHVVDADASQTRVIEEVRRGRNLVVQGPPGTGKSQTITNIIASAVHDGKTVLFVAEKMAALNVVHHRLKKCGLGDMCLELHSNKTNKRAVVEELGRTLNVGRAVQGQPSVLDELHKKRTQLNSIRFKLHEPLEQCDYSPFSAMAEIAYFIGKDAPPPSFKQENLYKLSNQQRDSLCNKIENYKQNIKKAGLARKRPLRSVGNLDLQPTGVDRLWNQLPVAIAAIDAVLDNADKIASALERNIPRSITEIERLLPLLDHIESIPERTSDFLPILFEQKESADFGDALEFAQKWKNAREENINIFTEAAWSVPLSEIRIKISKGVGSFLYRLLGGYRGASREFSVLLKVPLPNRPQERLVLCDHLLTIRRYAFNFEQYEGIIKGALGKLWRGERTDFNNLIVCWQWLSDLIFLDKEITFDRLIRVLGLKKDNDSLRRSLNDSIKICDLNISSIIKTMQFHDDFSTDWKEIDLLSLQNNLNLILSSREKYSDWVTLSKCMNDLKNNGLSLLCEKVEDEKLPIDDISDEFRYAVAESRWSYTLKVLPELAELRTCDRHKLVEEFKGLERKRFDEVRAEIRAKHLNQLPTGAVGEMGYIRGQIAKKRGIASIRNLITHAGSMVKRIKPVFLTSLIAVAQFLPPEKLKFDLLVIDEASQVRPEDAIGAVARAKQIVVVGDDKQLPPTSFFESTTQEDNSDDGEDGAGASATEMESILTLCAARGMRNKMLEWHYRSRDPSLIRVSNTEFYENRLVLPPSPLEQNKEYGLKLVPVNGIYIREGSGSGRQKTNRIEAMHIADALAQHARKRSSLSVGVVAFSKHQSDMISEVLEARRREDEYLDALLREDKNENVFIKNIENVQGDERDVILISVCYGPSEPDGRLTSMRFGPINLEGGGRRLNVLFSRARVQCQVFASFDPGEIDLGRAKGDGVRILKRFLDFAKTGCVEEASLTGQNAESPLEADVARVIESYGYYADPQVGSAGFRIDIGVRHPDCPGTYILAVECDGATYHSALWARERDWHRQEILENLGWRFHRIWSTDWFYQREQEIKRLVDALEKAKVSPVSNVMGANKNDPVREHVRVESEPLGDAQPTISSLPPSLS